MSMDGQQTQYPRKPCRRCQTRKAYRAGGLCSNCYGTPGVRAQYPPDGQFSAERSGGDFFGGYHPPPEPAAGPPGSAAKLAALAERARLRVSLWHPRDADHETKGT